MTFKEFLQLKLSHHQYENLYQLIDTTKNQTTRLINNPSRGTVNQLIALTGILQKGDSSFISDTLIKQYKFGQPTQCNSAISFSSNKLK